MFNNSFRIWIISQKKMIYNSNDFVIDMTGKLLFKLKDSKGYIEYDYVPKALKDNFIIQYYTGVVDYNHRKVFEGDIINGLMHNETNNFIETTAEIKFIDPANGFKLNCWSISTIKVVGNIFENPELIKEYGNS